MINKNWIKDKHSLVDLAKFGTRARKLMHPDVLIGAYPPGCAIFKEGDILDANATATLAHDIYEQGGWYESAQDTIKELHDIVKDAREKISHIEKRSEAVSYDASNELLTITTSFGLENV